jgi:hypothetical protein
MMRVRDAMRLDAEAFVLFAATRNKHRSSRHGFPQVLPVFCLCIRHASDIYY